MRRASHMDPQLLELLRCLQSGPFDDATLARVCELLRTQHAALAEVSELLESWCAQHAQQIGGEQTAAATLFALLGELRSQAGDISGAVAASERALDAAAEPELIERLAELYAARAGQGDREQAADLYYTLGEALGNPAGIGLLERVLDLVPGHAEATALLQQYTGARPLRPRSGRTQVGFKVDLMALEEVPLATLDGTPIPPPSVPPTAAEPPSAEAPSVAAKASVATGAAASWPPAAPRRSVPPTARRSVPPTARKSSPPASAARAPASMPPALAATAPLSELQHAVAAAAPAMPARASSTLDDELASVSQTKRGLPNLRVLVGGGVAAAVVIGLIGWLMRDEPRAVVTPVAASAPLAAVVTAAAAPVPVSAPPTAAAAAPSTATGPVAPQVTPAPSGPEVEPLIKLATVRGGTISDEALSSAIDKATPKLDKCYAQTLKKKPGAKGRLTLGFMVRTNGRAMRVKQVSSTIKDAALYRCTAKAVTSTRFPKPRKKNAQIKLPIEYRAG